MDNNINTIDGGNLRDRNESSRVIFNKMVDTERVAAARTAWDRAYLASRLRHAVVSQGKQKSAKQLSALKLKAIKHAFRLAPECLTVGIDGEYQIGLPCIRWIGCERLHLSWDLCGELSTGRSESEPRTDSQAS